MWQGIDREMVYEIKHMGSDHDWPVGYARGILSPSGPTQRPATTSVQTLPKASTTEGACRGGQNQIWAGAGGVHSAPPKRRRTCLTNKVTPKFLESGSRNSYLGSHFSVTPPLTHKYHRADKNNEEEAGRTSL